MKYLFDNKETIRRFLTGRFVYLFLDYDGTLTPIVESPGRAALSEEARGLLDELSKSPKLKLAIVSGRSLKELQKIVHLNDIIYVGNHGFEIKGPKFRFEGPISTGFKAALKKIKEDLDRRLSAVKGVFIEDKGLTLSVHYRLVNTKDELLVKNIFYESIQPYLISKKARLTYGKKVFEVRPVAKWDKGKAVIWLLARERFRLKGNLALPVYIGDDLTDESAFNALKKKGLTISVGKAMLLTATYYLNNTSEVIRFLKLILVIQKDKYICQG